MFTLPSDLSTFPVVMVLVLLVLIIISFNSGRLSFFFFQIRSIPCCTTYYINGQCSSYFEKVLGCKNTIFQVTEKNYIIRFI